MEQLLTLASPPAAVEVHLQVDRPAGRMCPAAVSQVPASSLSRDASEAKRGGWLLMRGQPQPGMGMEGVCSSANTATLSVSAVPVQTTHMHIIHCTLR
jgi:hypothetical protein